MKANEKISFTGYAWKKYRTLLLALLVAFMLALGIASAVLKYHSPERDIALVLIVGVWFISFGAGSSLVAKKYTKHLRSYC